VLAALRLLALALAMLVAYAGTERLGRPLTDDEKKRFGALLREHDYPGAGLVALHFAYKLTRSIRRAQDLMGRVDIRLVRFGWDPAEVALVRRLCRLVWSEWTHAVGDTEKARKAEEGFLRDTEAVVPSTEQLAVVLETIRGAQARGAEQLEKLRGVFMAAGDEVNLLVLKYASDEGIDPSDMKKMAAMSDRNIADFKLASERRMRAVRKLLAQERGVDFEGKES
jgi:hypothetical protein